MPNGSQGQKRPAGLVGDAIKAAKIATGEIKDDKMNPAEEFMRQGGLKGGKARALAFTPKKLKEIAKLAAKARWGK